MRKKLYETKFSKLLKKNAASELPNLTDEDLRFAMRRAVKNTFVPIHLEKKVRAFIGNYSPIEFTREKGNL